MNDFKSQVKRDANKEKSENPFKAKILFDDMEFLIYDCFEYKGIKYYYIIEDKTDKIKNEEGLKDFLENSTEKIRIEFIFETNKERHLYETVTDQTLLRELNIEESKRIIEGKV